MQLLEASSEIDAPAAHVWDVLADFAGYPDGTRSSWRPKASYRRRAAQSDAPGAGPPGVTFRPRVLALEPGHLITWKGQWLLPGLFDGRHTLHVEPLGDDRAGSPPTRK